MRRTVLLATLWSLLGLVLIAGYYSFTFIKFWADELFCCDYGATVFVNAAQTIVLSVVHLALPIAAFIFFLSAFRDIRIRNRFKFKHVVFSCLLLMPLVFWWIGYRNPICQRNLYSLVFDIRMQLPEEEFGQNDSILDSPTTLSFSQLNDAMEERMDDARSIREDMIAKLQRVATIATLDSLIREPEAQEAGLSMTDFDHHKNINYATGADRKTLLGIIQTAIAQERYYLTDYFRLEHEQRKMIVYPLQVVLMVILGYYVSERTKKIYFSILLPVTLIVFFPVMAMANQYCNLLYRTGYISSWVSLLIVPAVLILVIFVLHLAKRKSYSRFVLDKTSIESGESEWL